jgi:hypothetical protein
MGKLKIYDASIPPEQIVAERDAAYLALSPEGKFNQLLALIRLSVEFNRGEPLKKPQGKGIVIFRPK